MSFYEVIEAFDDFCRVRGLPRERVQAAREHILHKVREREGYVVTAHQLYPTAPGGWTP